MQKKLFNDWQNSTRKTLSAVRKFRKLCDTPFDRGFIGELLVLDQLLKTYKSKLCASENNGFIYEGSSNKKWDISLTINNKTVYINAKATSTKDKNNNPRWVRQHAISFCDIDFEPGFKQKVGGARKEDPNLFYVFVDVGSWSEHTERNFFTLSHKKAASIFRKKYFELYNGEIRESTDFWIEYEDIKKYKDENLMRIFK